MKKAFLISILIIVVAGAGIFFYFKYYGTDGIPTYTNKNTNAYSKNENAASNVNSFAECAAATGIVQESYPRRCVYNGQSFTEDIGNELEMTDTIQVDSPRPNASVESPLTISGKARGSWFFEAQAPAELYDDNQELIGQVAIRATGDWQTENFVDFTAELTFPTPETETGTLILKNDNPSGLPQNEKKLTIPVLFTSIE